MIARSNHTKRYRGYVDNEVCSDPKDQLRRLPVASANGPEVGTKKRSDERRKVKKVEYRQLEYWCWKRTQRRRLCVRRSMRENSLG